VSDAGFEALSIGASPTKNGLKKTRKSKNTEQVDFERF
jgi:hypothetical protein